MSIETIKIHPAIGIARLGNSPTEFFVGPEIPGTHPEPKDGYRDANGRIKRQAARFRLFGYDKRGKLVKEITSADATIEWTVHIANSKAAWREFDGLKKRSPFRNPGVTDRKTLVIDPGSRSITGPNKGATFDTGSFLGTPVPLGEIRSDAKAQLLVLGGFGTSTSPVHAPITTYANNDGWHDDVSDGPVNARVTLKGSSKAMDAVGAWVIVGPPKYAPAIDNVITLYDVLLQTAVDKLGLKIPAKPSFTKDIYPLFQRAINMRWVSGMVEHPPMEMGHDEEEGADHEESEAEHEEEPMKPKERAHKTLQAAIPHPVSAADRKKVFEKLRDPALGPNESSGESDMPMIHSDYYPKEVNQPLTRIQYGMMKKWKNGSVINDWSGPPRPEKVVTPQGLDRAGIESCVGGALYPGIEAGWLLRDVYAFSEPFRLDPKKLKPGDITKQMAVPWQADFKDCEQDGELAWWPAQRPDDVFTDGGGPQVKWTRDIANTMLEMIHQWHRLGFVVKEGKRYIEKERIS